MSPVTTTAIGHEAAGAAPEVPQVREQGHRDGRASA